MERRKNLKALKNLKRELEDFKKINNINDDNITITKRFRNPTAITVNKGISKDILKDQNIMESLSQINLTVDNVNINQEEPIIINNKNEISISLPVLIELVKNDDKYNTLLENISNKQDIINSLSQVDLEADLDFNSIGMNQKEPIIINDEKKISISLPLLIELVKKDDRYIDLLSYTIIYLGSFEGVKTLNSNKTTLTLLKIFVEKNKENYNCYNLVNNIILPTIASLSINNNDFFEELELIVEICNNIHIKPLLYNNILITFIENKLYNKLEDIILNEESTLNFSKIMLTLLKVLPEKNKEKYINLFNGVISDKIASLSIVNNNFYEELEMLGELCNNNDNEDVLYKKLEDILKDHIEIIINKQNNSEEENNNTKDEGTNFDLYDINSRLLIPQSIGYYIDLSAKKMSNDKENFISNQNNYINNKTITKEGIEALKRALDFEKNVLTNLKNIGEYDNDLVYSKEKVDVSKKVKEIYFLFNSNNPICYLNDNINHYDENTKQLILTKNKERINFLIDLYISIVNKTDIMTEDETIMLPDGTEIKVKSTKVDRSVKDERNSIINLVTSLISPNGFKENEQIRQFGHNFYECDFVLASKYIDYLFKNEHIKENSEEIKKILQHMVKESEQRSLDEVNRFIEGSFKNVDISYSVLEKYINYFNNMLSNAMIKEKKVTESEEIREQERLAEESVKRLLEEKIEEQERLTEKETIRQSIISELEFLSSTITIAELDKIKEEITGLEETTVETIKGKIDQIKANASNTDNVKLLSDICENIHPFFLEKYQIKARIERLVEPEAKTKIEATLETMGQIRDINELNNILDDLFKNTPVYLLEDYRNAFIDEYTKNNISPKVATDLINSKLNERFGIKGKLEILVNKIREKNEELKRNRKNWKADVFAYDLANNRIYDYEYKIRYLDLDYCNFKQILEEKKGDNIDKLVDYLFSDPRSISTYQIVFDMTRLKLKNILKDKLKNSLREDNIPIWHSETAPIFMQQNTEIPLEKVGSAPIFNKTSIEEEGQRTEQTNEEEGQKIGQTNEKNQANSNGNNRNFVPIEEVNKNTEKQINQNTRLKKRKRKSTKNNELTQNNTDDSKSKEEINMGNNIAKKRKSAEHNNTDSSSKKNTKKQVEGFKRRQGRVTNNEKRYKITATLTSEDFHITNCEEIQQKG